MRRSHLAACAAVFTLAAAPSAVAKAKNVDSSRLDRNVTVQGIVQHQAALQNIADLNGGTRHTRTPGYTASAAYVKSMLERAGYRARYEMFNMPIWHETAAPVLQLTSPSSKTFTPGTAEDDDSPDVDFIAFEHAPTAAVQRQGRADQRHRHPQPRRHDERLEESDFPAETSGAVSLIQRGTCGFTLKLQNAVAAGAVGVILFNEGDTPDRSNALFRAADPNYPIPAVSASTAVGEELNNLAKSGQNPTVNLATSGVERDAVPERRGREPGRRPGSHGVRRRAPGLGHVRAGRQRRWLRHGVPARARRAAREGAQAAAEQDPFPLLRRRGGRPRGFAVLRRPPVRRRGLADGHDARHRHDRVVELRPPRL